MRKQDYILQLIGTLSPNDKRYFKLYSSLEAGDKRYLKLFDALENKQSYDAAALAEELGWTSQQLKSAKYYLSQVLLRSLVNNEEAIAIRQLHRGYSEARIVFQRRLFNYALDLVEKLIVQAEYLEQFVFMPNLLSLKESCLYGLQEYDAIQQVSSQLPSLQSSTAELFEINKLNAAITAAERLREGPSAVKKLMEHPLLKKEFHELKSLKAQAIWFDIMSRCYFVILKDAGEYLKLIRSEVKLYESRPQILDIAPLNYLLSYGKLGYAEIWKGNHEVALEALDKLTIMLKDPPVNVPPKNIEALGLYCLYLKSLAMRYLRRFNESLPLLERACSELGEGHIYEQYTYNLELAVALFHTGHIKKAADKLNELLMLNTTTRMDLQLLVRPLMILIQIEMGNQSVVPYLAKSAKAWLKRMKKNETQFDKFFSYALAVAKADRSKMRQALSGFLTGIEAGEMKFADDFDLRLWVEGMMKKNKRPSS